ncbi:MAG: hypothetical protein H0T95_10440 [Chthoniobacterales bacterium]|nr:hypothetical protein [Chthoniobacterales bacterium]
MKHTPLMKLLAVGTVTALTLSSAFAQVTKEATTTTTTAGGTGVSASTSASTSMLDGTGTITTYSPGTDYIQMRTEASTAPTKYYYSKSTTVVDPTGAAVDMALLRPDMPVKYSYVKEGDRMVISKITVQKPLAEIKKTTTTTTTTP